MTNSKAEPPAPDDDATDLPALATWPKVYAFVLGTFVLWVVLLTILSRAYS